METKQKKGGGATGGEGAQGSVARKDGGAAREGKAEEEGAAGAERREDPDEGQKQGQPPSCQETERLPLRKEGAALAPCSCNTLHCIA